jgi:hypothetical protein
MVHLFYSNRESPIFQRDRQEASFLRELEKGEIMSYLTDQIFTHRAAARAERLDITPKRRR